MTATTLPHDIGTRLHDELSRRLGENKAALWFGTGVTFEHEDQGDDPGVLRIAAPHSFFAERLRRQGAADVLAAAAQDVLGEPVAVRIEVREPVGPAGDAALESDFTPPRPQPAAGRTPPPRKPPTACGAGEAEERPRREARRPSRRGHAGHPYADTGLRHRLEDFVVTPGSQLAYAAADRLATADPDDKTVCGVPLFIHGGCGLGKTHLLQGICRRWIERRGGSAGRATGGRVLYTTGEQFTNRYIDHAQRGTLDAFRKAMRHVDLLAIDDIHFIAGKAKTQTEFLHCFDAIELCGAPVVLASDQHPRQIKQFSEALSSRCLRGLVLEIEPPDTAARRKLVAALSTKQGLILQPAALDTLAGEVGPSVREIEGTLRQLHALATLAARPAERSPLGVSVGMAMVDRLLSHQRQACPPKPATVPVIAKVVAETFALTPRQVLGSGRQRNIVLARSVTAHLARLLTPMSYPEIAEAMHRPNHSSVITADKRVKGLLDQDQHVQLPTRDEPVRLCELLDDLKHAIRKAS